MKLWQQVDWKHSFERSSVTTFARTFRVKLGKLDTLDAIASTLSRSRYWISFDQNGSVHSAMTELVDHLVETYASMPNSWAREPPNSSTKSNFAARPHSWELPKDPGQGAKAMAALKQAEPMLEPRPFVKNGSSDTLGWAVFSSSDWAELEAADLYATHALFPLKGAVPKAPALPQAEAMRRQRTPDHEALLGWVSANKDELTAQLVDALEKLETSHPDSTEERDATSQIYRISRRARR
jgi:hypothetical protein